MTKNNNSTTKKSQFKLLGKLTLLVPTRDRNYYLSRWLWYTSNFPFAKIIIADSSNDEKKKINQNVIHQVIKDTGANIQYIDCVPETDPLGGDIFRKWGIGLKYVNTEYCKMCTDKEFILISGIIECIEYLEQHPDYIASQGIVYTARRIISLDASYDYCLRLGYPNRRTESSECPLERYDDAFVSQKSWNNNMLVAIVRTDVNKYLYQLLDEYNIPGIRYAEIILGYVGYLIGKYHYSPEIDFSIIDFVLRDDVKFKKECTKGTTESCASRYPHFDEYVKMNVSDEYYSIYRNCMRDQLLKYSSLNVEETDKYIKETLTTELFYYYSCNLRSKNIVFSLVVQTLGKKYDPIEFWFKLPIVVRKIILPILYMFQINLPMQRNNIMKPYSSEINEILQIIEHTLYLHSMDCPLSQQIIRKGQ